MVLDYGYCIDSRNFALYISRVLYFSCKGSVRNSMMFENIFMDNKHLLDEQEVKKN